MAVWLTEISKVGALDRATNVGGDTSQIPHYDSNVTSKTFAIGAAGTELGTATRAITIADDASTGFRWALVSAADAALPDNSPVWLPGSGPSTWSIGASSSARFFKTAALA